MVAQAKVCAAVMVVCLWQVWPRSHVPIWHEQWRGFRQGQLHSMFRDGQNPNAQLTCRPTKNFFQTCED